MKERALQKIKSGQNGIKRITARSRYASVFITTFFILLHFLCENSIFAIELKIRAADPFSINTPETKQPGQLPQSRISRGNRNIRTAWLAGATDRYRHGVLGDGLEASQLIVETSGGKQIQVNLPENRVFEDLEPRLEDVNRDNKDEIIVVESDLKLGASLAVYGIIKDHLVKIAATPFLGRPNRWLNPVGVGDFDGDAQPDIALVATPHIGGMLRLYRFNGSNLSLFSEYRGVSTHRIGSTELGLGQVISGSPRDRLLVPNQARQALLLLEWTHDGLREITRVELPGYLGSPLKRLEDDRWRFRLENGKFFELEIKR